MFKLTLIFTFVIALCFN